MVSVYSDASDTALRAIAFKEINDSITDSLPAVSLSNCKPMQSYVCAVSQPRTVKYLFISRISRVECGKCTRTCSACRHVAGDKGYSRVNIGKRHVAVGISVLPLVDTQPAYTLPRLLDDGHYFVSVASYCLADLNINVFHYESPLPHTEQTLSLPAASASDIFPDLILVDFLREEHSGLMCHTFPESVQNTIASPLSSVDAVYFSVTAASLSEIAAIIDSTPSGVRVSPASKPDTLLEYDEHEHITAKIKKHNTNTVKYTVRFILFTTQRKSFSSSPSLSLEYSYAPR